MAVPLTDTIVARYGAITAGLLIGVAARYGLTLSEGQRLTAKSVIADMLLLGMLGVIAIAIADWLALTGNARVLVGALAGASGERLVRLARTAFLKRISSDLDPAARQLIGAARAADIAKVPAGIGVPDEIGAHSGTPDNGKARAGAALQGAFRRPTITRPPVDQIELLRRLDEDQGAR